MLKMRAVSVISVCCGAMHINRDTKFNTTADTRYADDQGNVDLRRCYVCRKGNCG